MLYPKELWEGAKFAKTILETLPLRSLRKPLRPLWSNLGWVYGKYFVDK